MLSRPMRQVDTLEFHDPRVAELFHQEEQAYYIIQFAKGPRTIEDAATEVGVSVSTMRRWAKRFTELGLIKVVGLDTGRSYLYQLAAQKIIIHDEAAPPDTPEDFVRTLGPRWERFVNAAVKAYNRQQEADPWVLVIQSKGDDWAEAIPMPRSEATGQKARPTQFYNHWFTPSLSPQAAQVIAADIEALLRKITELAETSESASPYVIHLGFARDIT